MKLRFVLPGWGFHVLVVVLGGLRPSGVAAQEWIDEKWNVRYDGTTDGVHEARAVATDVDGAVVATGRSVSANGFDFYTVKYRAADGVRLWDDRYDGTGDGDDGAVAVVLDGGQNVVVAGSSEGPAGSGLDVFIRKYNGLTGATLWSERYNGPSSGNDAAAALALDGDGNVVVTGYSAESGAGLDLYTAKYASSTGARLWFRRYNGTGNGDDTGVDVAVDDSGGVVVTSTSTGGGSTDIYTAKYAGSTNDLVWDERYDGPGGGDDAAAAVATDAAGNVFVVGTVSNNGNSDIYVSKLQATDGNEVWSDLDNGPGNGDDAGTALAVDAAGDVIVAGASDNGRNLDLVVTKFSGADGRRLWSDRYNGTGDGDDGATSVAVDGQGNIVVTGVSAGAGGDRDLYTAAYDGWTGKRLWFERFDGIRGRDEAAFPFGLALGPLNSVALAGSTQMTAPPNAEWDFLTVAYAVPSPQVDADADGLPDAWESTFFGTTVGHGPGDDADNDGVNERLEYAFGMNPTAADPGRVPGPVVNGGFLTLTLSKRSGVTFTVETSGTLAAGSWSVGTTLVTADTAGTLTVRDTVPVTEGGPRFMRVRVGAP